MTSHNVCMACGADLPGDGATSKPIERHMDACRAGTVGTNNDDFAGRLAAKYRGDPA